MTKKMLIDAAHPEEVRVALISQNKIEDFDFESAARKPLRGNIYLARVTRVEPSLQAAFVEYGGNRHGFLAFSEIHPDYYQIPVSDRRLLQQAEAKVAELASSLELSQRGDEVEFDDESGARMDKAEHAAGAETEVLVEPVRASGEDAHDDDEDDDLDDADDAAAAEEEEEEEEVKKTRAPSGDEAAAGDPGDAAAERGGETPPAAPEKADAAPDEAADVAAGDAADDAAASESEKPAARAKPSSREGDAKRNAKKERESRDALFERYKDAKRKRTQLLRNYKIQEVVKRRQILLVQVVKEERGNKGAALTTYLSLAGRYCVLMPNTARGGGISRKIANGSDRRRLRRVVDSLEVPQGMGLIVRTAGAKRTKTEIKRDYDYSLRLWENIRTLTLKSIAPCLIYEEASLIKRAIRDLYDKDISDVLVEGEAGYREAKDFMKMLMPSHAKNVQPYKERAPIFLHYGVEAQLDGMYLPTVRLKSGGYIVIHQTEALVAIDVNSGRSTRERNIEQTALRTNIEAAEEAARQFRLRDLAGLIVLDFIDMEEARNNRKVEKALKDALKSDRARIQAGRISPFGLLEMSRQRRRSGLVYGTTQSCPTCAGAGVIRSNEVAALRILRALEGEAMSGKVGKITVKASLDVGLHVLNHNREWLGRIEAENGVEIEIVSDQEKFGDAFDIEKSGLPRDRAIEQKHIRADQTEPVEIEEPETPVREEAEEQDAAPKRRRRRRSRKDATGADRTTEAREQRADESDEPARAAEKDARAETAGDEAGREDGKQKRRRRRGRRGGRRARRAGSDERPADDRGAVTGGRSESSADSSGPHPHEDDEAPAAAETAAHEADDGIDEAPVEALTAEPAKNGAEERDGAPDSRSREDEDTAQTPAAPVGESAADKDKKSAKKGWWQRALG